MDTGKPIGWLPSKPLDDKAAINVNHWYLLTRIETPSRDWYWKIRRDAVFTDPNIKDVGRGLCLAPTTASRQSNVPYELGFIEDKEGDNYQRWQIGCQSAVAGEYRISLANSPSYVLDLAEIKTDDDRGNKSKHIVINIMSNDKARKDNQTWKIVAVDPTWAGSYPQ